MKKTEQKKDIEHQNKTTNMVAKGNVYNNYEHNTYVFILQSTVPRKKRNTLTFYGTFYKKKKIKISKIIVQN